MIGPKKYGIIILAVALLVSASEASPVPGSSENVGVEGAKQAHEAIDSAKDVGKAACEGAAEISAIPGKAMAGAAEEAFKVFG